MHETTFETFADYVRIVGWNAPNALVLDWWRRTDLALTDYYSALGEKLPALPRAIVGGEDRQP